MMDKYTISTEAAKPENKDKIIISNDAYAVCEFINKLMDKLESLRYR